MPDKLVEAIDQILKVKQF